MNSDEDLGDFPKILAIFGYFLRCPKIFFRFCHNPHGDLAGLPKTFLLCNRLAEFLLGSVGAIWTKIWRKIPESALNSKLSKGAKNRLQILVEALQHPQKARRSFHSVQQTCEYPLRSSFGAILVEIVKNFPEKRPSFSANI